MTLVAKCLKADAQSVLLFVRENHLFAPGLKIFADEQYVYIPVVEQFDFAHVDFVTKDSSFFPKDIPAVSFKQELAQFLTADELSQVKKGFDQIGDIAILEIDVPLRHKETEIACALLKVHTTIKTVLRKDGPHKDPYRTQPMKFLAGKQTTVTTHVENGISLIVDVEKTYFSPRMSTERKRLAQQITSEKTVLDLFCGIAPAICVIQPKFAVGIELNPDAVFLAKKNCDKNNVNATIIQADALKADINGTFDHILMNLPTNAQAFFQKALEHSHTGTVFHYYDFMREGEEAVLRKKIDSFFADKSFGYKILGVHTCGMQGIRLYRVCVDVKRTDIFC